MDTSALIDTLDHEGRLLADTAAGAGPDAPVPTCPEWRVRDLLSHLGRVHRFATRLVAEGLAGPPPFTPDPQLDGDALPEWFREGHRTLVGTLRAADPGLRCFTFFPAPSPLAFWARRQAHETAIHRVDAEAALGVDPSPVAPEFAADGLDELLSGFHTQERSGMRTDTPRTLRLRATDQNTVWTVWLSDGVPRTERNDDGAADCELSGPVGTLYFALWNRLPLSALDTEGDPELARLWRERAAIGG
ncbi:maleylpyruvate isomerase family mycothiol-dependent enzyme [Streptomyces sp. NA02950]|uniref:maleylpyruvate isomerase family mycothiol-dependent enzyme n=1 Tax=Streptomyces sp. NA02950 TaxID=2742137 RepID=UPI001590E17E|nr:maleylpyruvate isomerase family mycothiol-dependent enzyme [Streptomyces sp. NA02950]QKV91423.1 maleylpyruvate isomerase family mycothiol-dependent enzyme [Streptomyces sp. NA02950]